MLFKSKIKCRWHYLLVAVLMCSNLLVPGKQVVNAMIPPATSICIRQPDLCFEGLNVTLQVKDLTGKNNAGFTSEDIETYGEVKLKVTYTYSGENPGQTANVAFYCDKDDGDPKEKRDGLSESEANGREIDCGYSGSPNKIFFPKVIVEKGGERVEAFSGLVTLVGAQIRGDVYWQETKEGSSRQSVDGETSRRIKVSGRFIYPGLQTGARVIIHCNKGAASDQVINELVPSSDNGLASESGNYVSFGDYVCEYPSTLAVSDRNLRLEVTVQRDTGAYTPLVKGYSLVGKETIEATAEVYEYSESGSLKKVDLDSTTGAYNTSDYPIIRIKQAGYTGDKTLDRTTIYQIWGSNLSCKKTASSEAFEDASSLFEYTTLPDVEDPHDYYCWLNTSGLATVNFGVLRGWAADRSDLDGSTIKLNINKAPNVTLSATSNTIKSTDTLQLKANVTDPDGDQIAWVGFYYCDSAGNIHGCATFSDYLPLSSDHSIGASRSISTTNPYTFSSSGVLENGKEYNIIAAAQDINTHPAIGISEPIPVTVNDITINSGAVGNGYSLNYAVGSKQKEQ